MSDQVLTCREVDRNALTVLFERYRLIVTSVAEGQPIPGSFWGDSEAGLIGDRLYIRPDTPVHSALHEGCHYICMSPPRRARLHTNVGGSQAEENGTCYLQAVLADCLPGFDRDRCFVDMDRWGYSFRLGSAAAWFYGDADDARQWLLSHRLIDRQGQPTWQLRRTVKSVDGITVGLAG